MTNWVISPSLRSIFACQFSDNGSINGTKRGTRVPRKHCQTSNQFPSQVPEVKPSPLLQLETETVWIGVEGCNHHVLVGISEIECGNPRGFESAVGRVFSVSTTKSGDRQGFPTEPGLMIVAEPGTKRSLLDRGGVSTKSRVSSLIHQGYRNRHLYHENCSARIVPMPIVRNTVLSLK